jgi:ABC-type transport system involved in multi-copper enzyme maturation permease subunit
MKLPAFALFERSLRVETRSPMISWTRTGLLVLILLILLPIQAMGRLGVFGAPGLHFLEQMVWVNLIFITLAGLGYFASAITEEKEEMMLGLLRMTDLNGVAILLGKSTSRLVGALLLLVAQIPFILLAVSLGGVGLLQIEAAYSTLLAYLFLVCNLALLFSVLFRNTTTASGVTLCVLLFFLLAHYWMAALVPGGGSGMTHLTGFWFYVDKSIDTWRQSTPSDRLGDIFQTGFTAPAINFQVESNLVLGVLLFLLAWAVFDPCTREDKESAPSRRQWFSRKTTRQSRIPLGLIGPRAISWKDFTFMSGGRFGLFVKLGVVVGLMAFCNIFALQTGSIPNMTLEFEGVLLFWISILATAVFLALDAGRVFREEVRWKTLSSLITLPISVPELAYRKVAGNLAGTLPLLLGVIPGMLMAPKFTGDFFNGIFDDFISFEAFVVAILQFVLFLHLTAFLSLLIKRGALPLAIAIQYLGGSFSMTFIGFMFAAAGPNGPDVLLFMVGLFCAVMTVVLHVAIGRRLLTVAAQE